MPAGSVQPTAPVCVVVLAYNNVADTLECLGSATRLAYPNLRFVVVDNGSTDGTAETVRLAFPQVDVVATVPNVGIARGFNLGVIHALKAGAEYVLLLNNDTTVAEDLVDRLVEAGQANPNAAVLMPKVLYYDYPRTVWSAGARYRLIPPAIVFIGRGRPETQHDRARPIAYAPSCGLLVHRQAFERAGLFDPGYRFYYDDWDFCERVRGQGLAIAYVPEARMWHKVSRTIRQRPELFWETWGESCVRFYRRHGRPFWASLAIHLGYILLREAVQGNARSLRFFLRGARTGLQKPLGPIPSVADQGLSVGA